MTGEASERAPLRWESAGLVIVLAAIFVVFRGTFAGYFVQDDFSWLRFSQFQNPGELLKCFFRFNGASTYRPLSQETFFWLGRKAFGLQPPGYHGVSLFFHLLSAGLVYCLLRKFSPPAPSLIGALLFGAHGAHFRSVYWISAFPEPLALVFYLSGVLSFIAFDREHKRVWYWLSVASMVLGLMSKESILTLPCVLLLYCLLFARSRLFWTIPHFALAGAYFILRITSDAVTVAPYGLTFGKEALGNLVTYLAWTAGFTESVIHLRPVQRAGIGYTAAAVICAAGLACMIYLARRRRVALFGIGWFALALQPVLYFDQHIYSYYLAPALVGLALIAAAALPAPRNRRDWPRWALFVAVAVCILVYTNASIWREGMAWNTRTFVARDILRQMPRVASQIPPGGVAFLFGLGERELGALEKDCAFRVFGFSPEKYIEVGIDLETPALIRRLERDGLLQNYYSFVYEQGVLQNRTTEFRKEPGRFLPGGVSR